MKKIGLLLIALVVAIGGLGVGYANWYSSVYMYGDVDTGNVCVGFLDAFSDDPCMTNSWQGEPADFPCPDPVNTDPVPCIQNRPYVPWKDYASTTVELQDIKGCPCTECDIYELPHLAYIEMLNVYPNYAPTVDLTVMNIGTIPVNIVGMWIIYGPPGVDPQDESTWIYVDKGVWYDMDLNGDGYADINIAICGPEEPQQIDPCDYEDYRISLHVKQEYPQCNHLDFVVKLRAMQWNLQP